jgi:hypothetical protein
VRQGAEAGQAVKYRMTATSWNSDRTRMSAPALAWRMGVAAGGALAGMLVAVYLITAGVAFIDPFEMVAVFALVGAIASWAAAEAQPRGRAALRGEATVAIAAGVKRADSIQTLGAFGTLFANSAALLAASLVVAEAPPRVPWAIVIGVGWLLGVASQISAGILARVRAVDPEVL